MKNKRFKTIIKETSKVEYVSSEGSSHVVVVMGGMSSEHEVSLSSSVKVVESLLRQNYKVTTVDMGIDIAKILTELKPDVVFNCLHGTFGEDGCIQGLLNIMRIPYTHAGLLVSALAFNKIKVHNIFEANKILFPRTFVVDRSVDIKNDPINRPYVIKPIAEGSSIGVDVVFDGDTFDFSKYNYEYGNKILIQEYIKGKELQVAILNGKVLSGVLELKMLKNRFYDYESKYTDGFVDHIFPAKIDNKTYERIIEISHKICDVFDLKKGIYRIEFIYDEVNDDIYVLELNTHPGITPLSICQEIASHCGISFDEFIKEILSTASFD